MYQDIHYSIIDLGQFLFETNIFYLKQPKYPSTGDATR